MSDGSQVGYSPTEHEINACADRVWALLMDWCKNRGVPPSDYDDLFCMVSEIRKLSRQY